MPPLPKCQTQDSILRSGKPERAAATFERALETIQNRLRPQSSLTLARCLFNAGEAKRQAGDLAAAREYLDEAASVMSAERTAGERTTCTVEIGGGGERISAQRFPCGGHYNSGLYLVVAELLHPVLW